MTASPSIADQSVLIVDDDEFSCELMADHMRRLGFRDIRTAGDGAAAMRMLRSGTGHPDYLVCDVFMPDADGFEVVSALAAAHFKGTVVLVSGANPEMLALLRGIVIDNGLKLGGTCVKPVFTEQIALAMGLPVPAA